MISVAFKKVGFKQKNNDSILFHDLDLVFPKGETTCLFGPSGIGKTTMLRLIAGLISPDNGLIQYGNTETSNVRDIKMSYLFQDSRLLPWATVCENIDLSIHYWCPDIKVRERNILSAIRKMRITQLADKLGGELSGGEARRASLAQVVAMKPRLLLLDEPFSHLDEITAHELRNELKELLSNRQVTTIMVTHNPFEAIFFADQIYILKKINQNTVLSKTIKPEKRKRSENYEDFVTFPDTTRLVQKLFTEIAEPA